MARPNPPTVKDASGRRTVVYRDTNGKTREGVVVGGTGTSLNLRLTSHRKSGSQGRLVSSVAKATTRTQTNVWR